MSGCVRKKLLNPNREKCKLGSKKNPRETTLVFIPHSNNNQSPLKTQDHLFIYRSGSGVQPGGISFSKLQKVARPSITLVYYNLHKGRFANPGLKNITFCILLRIQHCPVPDILARLSINAGPLVPPAPGMVSVTKQFIVLSQIDNICNLGRSQRIGDFITLSLP
ncbi:hypothetical protein AVEN_157642-1 [Araneus ventricosus]|uniref:Uncharacterized protein n=1 Tax=Araneus ventricosus TaxID=182803 RepID=A0A4Y2S2S9_ARAVE|nr:hypothetical protein AVEN_201102-1 [Araneus ventricosus]GBN82408.1 hypothetical protein AVEN_157642-1 [Araneus ventricosus]